MTDYAITEHDIDRLRRAGACYLPAVGTPLSEIPAKDLAWAAISLPDLAEAERETLQRLCGARSWYRDGKRHREDGPAIEYADGTREWWRDGKRIDREDDAA